MATRTVQSGCGRGPVGQTAHCSFESRRCDLGVFAMALEAPPHRERRDLLHPIHAFHRAVASLASDAGEHVLAVIEVHEIGKIMDLDPADGTLLLHCLFELLDFDGLFFE